MQLFDWRYITMMKMNLKIAIVIVSKGLLKLSLK